MGKRAKRVSRLGSGSVEKGVYIVLVSGSRIGRSSLPE